jgi:hypothetical protein
LTRDILSQLVAWRLMLVAQFLKELPAAGQVTGRQAAMIISKPWQQIIFINSHLKHPDQLSPGPNELPPKK